MSGRRVARVWCAGWLALAGVAWAAPAAAVGLLQAWTAALEHDATYRASREEARAARELVEQARGLRRPEVQLSAAASVNQLDQRTRQIQRSLDYNSNALQLQLRQPLFNREIERRESLARLRAQQAEALLDVRRHELARRLVEAYLDLARADLGAALAREDIERQSLLIDLARRGLNSGEGTVTELLEASSRRALFEAQLAAAQAERGDAIDALRAITGVGDGWPTLSSPSAPGPALREGVALAAIEAVLPMHPQWRFRQIGIDLAREEVRLAEAANAPRLDLTASASRGDSDGVNTVNQVNRLWSAGVQFSMPLYDGGRTDSATRAALALADKAEAELEDTRRNLLNEAARSLRALSTSLQRLQALETAMQTAEQLVAATRRSLGAGLRSRADLVLAERQLAQVRREQRQLVIDHLRHWWRLSALQRAAPEDDLPTIENALR